MPGFLLHQGATVLCAHGGQAQLTSLFPRVKVMGQAVVLQILPSTIAGCTNPPPPTNVGPCAFATWSTAATRVKIMGQPVLLRDSQSTCFPTGTSLTVIIAQTRVKGI